MYNQENIEKFLSNKVRKYSVCISGHSTSITLEPPFWEELKKISKKKNIPIHELISEIDEIRSVSLSSACRLYVLKELSHTK